MSSAAFGLSLTVLGEAKLDAEAAAAGEQLHVQDALANLGPLAHHLLVGRPVKSLG